MAFIYFRVTLKFFFEKRYLHFLMALWCLSVFDVVVKDWYYLTGARAVRRRAGKALLCENLQSKLHAAGSCGWVGSRRAVTDVIAVFMQSGDDRAE